ncbi:unnamed protein product [Oikopleura dioica]|uniref:Uncharacterized protein n=1 Tax=Oikopleura dioica TaxID=34765 RepID=E4XUW3_OIKDI|nr:unnamed protein product [Oikopleura dioica]
MKTLKEGDKTAELLLWTKQVCETIDYDTQDELFNKILLRTSDIIAKLRKDKTTISPSMKAGIVFRIRRIETITNFIRKAVPQYAMDVVAISIPETREIMKLNEMELEAPELKTTLSDVALIPSLAQRIIDDRNNEKVHQQFGKAWDTLWNEITSGTTALERGLYCKAVSVIEGPMDEGKIERAMKRIFGDAEHNRKAVANWYASRKEIQCNSAIEAKKWQLRPIPERNDTEETESTEEQTKYVIPGHCSYELKWSAAEIFSKRKFNTDAIKEDKILTLDKKNGAKTKRFLERKDIFGLSNPDKFDDIDRRPEAGYEITPRRLTFQEKRGMKYIMVKKWTNFALWNPKYTITKITDSQMLKFWDRSYKALVERMTTELEKREEKWYNSLEQITLGFTIERPGNEVGSSCLQQMWRNMLKHPDDDQYISEMQKGLTLFSQKARQENMEYIRTQIDEGCSLESVLAADQKLGQHMDIKAIMEGLENDNRYKKMNEIYELIYRYTDRKELNKISVGKPWGEPARGNQIARLNGVERVKQSNWTCKEGNNDCIGLAMTWICKDTEVLNTACESTCLPVLKITQGKPMEYKELESSARMTSNNQDVEQYTSDIDLETMSTPEMPSKPNPAKRQREQR